MTDADIVRRARRVAGQLKATSRALRYIFDDLPLVGVHTQCDSIVAQTLESVMNAADLATVAAERISEAIKARKRGEL